MDQSELNNLMSGLWQQLRGYGIPVSKKLEPAVRVNTRAKRRLGCCYYYPGGVCAVEISARTLLDLELLRTTLVHELLHTCPGCRNHGERWKAYASIAGESMQLDIRRTVRLEEEPQQLRHEEVKYILECQSCGARIERMRMSKAVKSPWRYRCRCGGKLKRIC